MIRWRSSLSALAFVGLLLLPAFGSDAQMAPGPAAGRMHIGLVADGRKPPIPVGFDASPPDSDVRFFGLVRYSDGDRNILKVGTTERPRTGSRIVLLFVRGEGFVEGSPGSEVADPFYDEVMRFAARNGFVAISMSHRLAPVDPWPAGAEDVAGAIAWIRDNGDLFGGDPKKIVVVAHAAGDFHPASYLAHSEL
jgi:triacylglycerol lipase